ncbi:CCA tRNA nucleotidyltransferase [Altererythrobacter sp. MF3-039]|uniref:CCA tRNA nucleotidyltransferase n=1 Tax=Altererythrobacter sp. MF3-039 TaxID=3252901 RepID=UPI00390CCB43
MSQLPAAPWTQRADLAALVAALGHDKLRWVGGAVRDTLLGADVRDVDAATMLTPQEVIAACTKAGIKTAPTGIDHGTITAVLDDGPVEVTTLRKDVETDGRHAKVEYSTEWQEDASRRDFTINALYADPVSLIISDYFGGLEDLEAGRVQFIGDARQRIREDYLRILRYFRFQTRFGSKLDPQAEEACSELAEGLRGLSRERVAMELSSLLGLPDPAETAARMRELGVLGEVLPEATPKEIGSLAKLVANELANGIEPDPLRRLAALLPPIRAVAESVAVRLRLSRKKRERLACASERSPHDKESPQALAYRHGRACAIDRLLLSGASVDTISGWEIPRFPLKGGEIVARGISAGPEVATILRQIEDRWVAEGFPDRAVVDRFLNDEMLHR